MEMVIGRHSGSRTINHFLEKHQLKLNESHTALLTEQVKAFSLRNKRGLQFDELINLANNLSKHEL